MKKPTNSKRYDVVNKAILRSMRRFFLNKFKLKNCKVVNRRFIKTSLREILKGFSDVVQEVIGTGENMDQISQFVMIFSEVNFKYRFPFDKEISNEAGRVVDCMYNYSHLKMNDLFTIPMFKQLFHV